MLLRSNGEPGVEVGQELFRFPLDTAIGLSETKPYFILGSSWWSRSLAD